MAEVTLDFIASQLDRVLREQSALRNDVAELRSDMEVTAALSRRMDATMQGLIGEVRALAGQQSRQRQRLDRLQHQLEEHGES